jgi:acetoin utilization protein AcuC
MRSALIYTDAYVKYQYSDTHPLQPYRLQLTHDLMQSYGVLHLPQSRVVDTVPAHQEELEAFHTPE